MKLLVAMTALSMPSVVAGEPKWMPTLGDGMESACFNQYQVRFGSVLLGFLRCCGG